MKILNGKRYFDKSDVKDIVTLAKEVVNNPYDDLDFLLKANKDEISGVICGIDALANTISWEFTTENAVGLVKIEELAKTLRMPISEMITYEEYCKIPIEKVSKHNILRYENWLRCVGIDILWDEFKKNS